MEICSNPIRPTGLSSSLMAESQPAIPRSPAQSPARKPLVPLASLPPLHSAPLPLPNLPAIVHPRIRACKTLL